MKRHTLPIFILLVSASAAATPARANNSYTNYKESSSLYNEPSTTSSSGTLYKKPSPSLYKAGNAEYLHGEALFDFGPKAANIKYDKRMIEAMELASERAHKHSTSRCWSYVKSALVSAKLVPSRPTTEYAKEAGDELQHKYGFTKLAIRDPFAAPLGSVLVYGGRGAGHVEFRTPKGFVSDFTTDHPSRRPLIGVYVKPS
jgi:hypothetical protein